MKLISLFSGIGGFEIAAEWAGWTNIVSCEINPFGRRVLEYYWPNAFHHNNVFTLTKELIDAELTKRFGSEWNTDDIILSGGFPCQPYSAAGKRLGKEDERHLWPEMLRVIREVKPKWIVGENVFGLVTWSKGLVFEEVQVDLENEGYEVQAVILPACAVNAQHRRDRVWFIAHRKAGTVVTDAHLCAADDYTRNKDRRAEDSSGIWEQVWNESGCDESERIAAFTKPGHRFYRTDWGQFPTQSPVCPGVDGISTGLDRITFPKWRFESLKAGGNAIVPQVVYQIFKAINEFEAIIKK